MKRLVAAWGVFALLATGALLLARFLAPSRFALELDVFVLAVGGLALLELVVATRQAYPLERRSSLAEALEREPAEQLRPSELERLERQLTLASATAFDLHARLCPTLRELARTRLAARGVRLQHGEELVSEELWELVRPDRPPPVEPYAAGLQRPQLQRVLAELEAL